MPDITAAATAWLDNLPVISEDCPRCEGSGTISPDDTWLEANEPLGDGWQGHRPLLPCPDCHRPEERSMNADFTYPPDTDALHQATVDYRQVHKDLARKILATEARIEHLVAERARVNAEVAEARDVLAKMKRALRALDPEPF